MIKKIVLSLFAVLILPSAVLAADIKADDSVNIDQPLKNAYIFGSTVNINSDMAGDTVTFGSDIYSEKNIEKNLFTAGGTIKIDSPVGQNLRIFGGTVTVNGPVSEDEIIFSGTFTSTDKNIVSGDLIVNAGNVNANGTVKGKTKINGSSVAISGKYSGDVEINAEKIKIADNTEISGKLVYASKESADISSAAKIGSIEQKEFNHGKTRQNNGFDFLVRVIGLFILAIVLTYFSPKFTGQATTIAQNNTVRSALLGFCYLFLAPIAIIVIISTLIGMIFGFSLLCLYILSFFIAAAIAAIFTGKLVIGLINRKSLESNWLVCSAGAVIFILLGYIPVFGWFVDFSLIIISLGAILLAIFEKQTTQMSPISDKKEVPIKMTKLESIKTPVKKTTIAKVKKSNAVTKPRKK